MTKYTVIYGVYIWFWPTLLNVHYSRKRHVMNTHTAAAMLRQPSPTPFK